MIRFVKNILDITNILGMKRGNPEPDPVPDWQHVTLQSAETGSFYINVGTVLTYAHVEYTNPDGKQKEAVSNYPPQFNVDVMQFTDILVSNGNNVYNWSRITVDINASYFAPSSRLLGVYLQSNGALKKVDLRNANDNFSFLNESYESTIETIYARVASEHLLTEIERLIDGNSIRGVIWIDKSEAYAEDMTTYARSKGWTVYEL